MESSGSGCATRPSVRARTTRAGPTPTPTGAVKAVSTMCHIISIFVNKLQRLPALSQRSRQRAQGRVFKQAEAIKCLA